MSRRTLLCSLTVGLVASLVAGSALAAELFGTVAEVDPEARKIVVVAREDGKRVVVTVTDSTEWVSAKGKVLKKFDLEKFRERAGKAKVKVEHEDAVASRITLVAGKKAQDGDQGDRPKRKGGDSRQP